MIPQSALINFVQIVLTCALLGAALDGIFKREFMQQSVKPKRFLFRDYVAAVYAIVFDKFLGDTPYSKRYIIRSFAVSTLVVIVVFTLQSAYFSDLDTSFIWNDWKPYAFLLLGNAVIDYISIVQTQAFLRASKFARFNTSRIIFFLADLITSANLFIFIFAAVVSGFLLIKTQSYISIDKNPDPRESISGFMTLLKEKNLEEEPGFREENFKYNYIINRGFEISDDEYQYIVGKFSILSNKEFIDSNVFKYLPYINGRPTKDGLILQNAGELRYTGSEYKSYIDYIKEIQLPNDFSRHTFEEQPDFRIHRIYSKSYLVMDRVEDGFWGIFTKKYFIINMKNFIASTDDYFTGHTYYCVSKNDGNFYPIKDRSESYEGIKCDYDTYIISGLTADLDRHYFSYWFEKIDARLPFSTFFISSFSITLLFYIIFFAVFVIRNLLSFTARSERIRSVVLKAPLTCSGFIIGLLLWSLTLGA